MGVARKEGVAGGENLRRTLWPDFVRRLNGAGGSEFARTGRNADERRAPYRSEGADLTGRPTADQPSDSDCALDG